MTRTPRVGSFWARVAAGLLIALAFVMIYGVASGVPASPDEQAPTVVIDHDRYNLPTLPAQQGQWRTRVAFPNIGLELPMKLVEAAGQLYVLENEGRVYRFENDPQVSEKTLVLDFSENMSVAWPYTNGALGMALHPEFGQADSPNRGYIYVLYEAYDGTDHFARLARFTLPEDGGLADLSTETVLIDQHDGVPDAHLGGGLAFSLEGFLYVGLGDEGGRPDKHGEAQSISAESGLFAGIMRIDVDQVGGEISHPIRLQPVNGRTAGYYIPSDNPFIGQDQALEEYYAMGLRNPLHLSFDRVTGELWEGEVGHYEFEEINLIQAGGNYGWSYREGVEPYHGSPLRGRQPDNYVGFEVDPVICWPHRDSNNCAIGGFVYRGERFPELYGKYIYGDNGSGRVWGLTRKEDGTVDNELLTYVDSMSAAGLLGFGEDAQGELYMCIGGTPGNGEGRILTLERVPDSEQAIEFPPTLSDTGLFEDVATLTPSAGLLAYEVNSPLWSDGAAKQRWFSVPQGEAIQFSETEAWRFPAGTIFAKHFELPIDERDPSLTRRLETRVLVRPASGEGVFGATYRWDEDQQEAYLLDDGLREQIAVTDSAGNPGTQTWVYPSRHECIMCHNRNAGYVLGVNTRQLNGPGGGEHLLPGENQLAGLERLGLFDVALAHPDLTEYQHLVNVGDESASLEERSRSYIDANCSHCHRPGGRAQQWIDARYNADWQPGQETIETRGRVITRMSQAEMRNVNSMQRMPALGSLIRNREAIMVIKRWHLSDIPMPVHAVIYLMCVGVCLTLFAVSKKLGLSRRTAVIVVLLGIGWMVAIQLMSRSSLFEYRIKKVWVDWIVVGGIVFVGSCGLLLPRVRRAVALAPRWVLILPHVLRLTALVVVPLAGLAFVTEEYLKPAYIEAAVAIAALPMTLLISRCGGSWAPRLIVLGWNVLGVLSLLFMLKGFVRESEWIMHREPLVMYSLAGMPLIVLLHVYSAVGVFLSAQPKPEHATPQGTAATPV